MWHSLLPDLQPVLCTGGLDIAQGTDASHLPCFGLLEDQCRKIAGEEPGLANSADIRGILHSLATRKARPMEYLGYQLEWQNRILGQPFFDN